MSSSIGVSRFVILAVRRAIMQESVTPAKPSFADHADRASDGVNADRARKNLLARLSHDGRCIRLAGPAATTWRLAGSSCTVIVFRHFRLPQYKATMRTPLGC